MTDERPKIGQHPGKMPDGIKLVDCTLEIVALFGRMTISDADRETTAFQGMQARVQVMPFYNPADREPYVNNWYLKNAAQRAMINAVASGRLPMWTDYSGQFIELEPSILFAANKWKPMYTVESGCYNALNETYGKDGPLRAGCEGAILWAKKADWSRLRFVLVAERGKDFKSFLPAEALGAVRRWREADEGVAIETGDEPAASTMKPDAQIQTPRFTGKGVESPVVFSTKEDTERWYKARVAEADAAEVTYSRVEDESAGRAVGITSRRIRELRDLHAAHWPTGGRPTAEMQDRKRRFLIQKGELGG